MTAFDWFVVFGGLMCASGLAGRSRLVLLAGMIGWLCACAVVGGALARFDLLHGGVIGSLAEPLVPARIIADLRRIDTGVAVPPAHRRSLSAPARATAERSVSIYAAGCSDAYWGSGWVIGPERIVTAAHVVAGASRVRLIRGNDTAEGRVERLLPEQDLAIVRAPVEWRAERRTSELGPGWAVGYPDGGDRVDISTSLVERYLRIPDTYGKPVRTRVLLGRGGVTGGMSGGPVIDARGRVVGTLLASTEEGLLAAPQGVIGGSGIRGAGRCRD